jgi:hypothetical protein
MSAFVEVHRSKKRRAPVSGALAPRGTSLADFAGIAGRFFRGRSGGSNCALPKGKQHRNNKKFYNYALLCGNFYADWADVVRFVVQNGHDAADRWNHSSLFATESDCAETIAMAVR